LIFFVAGCSNGEFPCRIINDKGVLIDIAYVTTAIVFILLTYFLFLRYKNKPALRSIE
jgi:hypothetical protein